MLALSRIFLYNWHRFNDHLLDIEDSLYLAGHNGAGKSSVLDALQLVLVADLGQVRFNSSAQDRSARSLDSYVRGKIGEGRLLRPGGTIAYVALEFREQRRDNALTIGVCIEAREGHSPERTFFILPEACDRAIFIPDGRPLTRQQLKQAFRNRKAARIYDQPGEYRAELLNRLGGLNERFVELFLRALTFQPIRNIREFVERWLLRDEPLAIEALQRVVERLNELDASAHDVETRVGELRRIRTQQDDVRRLRQLQATHQLLRLLLLEAYAEQQVADLHQRTEQNRQELSRAQTTRSEAEAAVAGTSAALLQAQLKLEQSDVIRRRTELQQRIREAQGHVSAIRSERTRLQQDLRKASAPLVPILATDALLEDERHPIRALVEAAAFDPASPPPDHLIAQIDTAIVALDLALARIRPQHFEAERTQAELIKRRDTLRAEIVQLQSGRKAYPPDVERLRDLLTSLLTERPPLLCELLEIPDERWQNAIEALLGGRRFNLVVPPRHFDEAIHALDQARAAQAIYDVGLIDLERGRTDGRPAQAGSLAQQVEVKAPLLRPYIDTVLGDIICCDQVAALRRHRRAVTPEVVLYSEWTVRALSPRSYQPWFIGTRARQSQIAARQRELAEVETQLLAVERSVRDLATLARSLDQGRLLVTARQRLEGNLDDRSLGEQIVGWQADLATLDLSGVAALEAEVRRLQALLDQETRVKESLIGQIARLEQDRQRLDQQLAEAKRTHADRSADADAGRMHNPQVIDEAQRLLSERREQRDLSDAIRIAESSAKGHETRAQNGQILLTEVATTYNTRYQFAGRPDPDDVLFVRELARLEETELPSFRERIGQARREADEELREHVLHKLREQILSARQQIARINDSLTKLSFHSERYRFISSPADELRSYHDLIQEAQVIGAGTLFESDFYTTHKDAFDQFYEALTRTPQSEAERSEQQRLTDYRSYLTYDIEVTHADGAVSRLSRIMGQTSGGETQTPFYLTIAASFTQLYRIGERTGRPTIRLVAFDEAFSKMDQDRIGATLDLFQQFGLQVITATPLERCEYLVPKMCTSLVLTSVGDTVLVEPYRNYAARLNEQ